MRQEVTAVQSSNVPPRDDDDGDTCLKKTKGVAVELEGTPCEIDAAGHHSCLKHLAQDVNVMDAGSHCAHNLGACS